MQLRETNSVILKLMMVDSNKKANDTPGHEDYSLMPNDQRCLNIPREEKNVSINKATVTVSLIFGKWKALPHYFDYIK